MSDLFVFISVVISGIDFLFLISHFLIFLLCGTLISLLFEERRCRRCRGGIVHEKSYEHGWHQCLLASVHSHTLCNALPAPCSSFGLVCTPVCLVVVFIMFSICSPLHPLFCFLLLCSRKGHDMGHDGIGNGIFKRRNRQEERTAVLAVVINLGQISHIQVQRSVLREEEKRRRLTAVQHDVRCCNDTATTMQQETQSCLLACWLFPNLPGRAAGDGELYSPSVSRSFPCYSRSCFSRCGRRRRKLGRACHRSDIVASKDSERWQRDRCCQILALGYNRAGAPSLRSLRSLRLLNRWG